MMLSDQEKLEMYKLAVMKTDLDEDTTLDTSMGSDMWKTRIEEVFNTFCSHFEEIKAKGKRESKKVDPPRFIKA